MMPFNYNNNNNNSNNNNKINSYFLSEMFGITLFILLGETQGKPKK